MNELTKVTVNLVPASMNALAQAVEVNEDTKTDTINRALQLYAAMTVKIAHGSRFIEIKPDGETFEWTLEM
jgi:hypothetical protein